MSIKQRMVLFTVSFLLTTIVLGFGAFYIVSKFGQNIESLDSEIQKDNMHEEFTKSVIGFMDATKGWIATGDDSYRIGYQKNVSAANEIIVSLRGLVRDTEAFIDLETEFDRLRTQTGFLLKERTILDVADQNAIMKDLETQEAMVHRKIGVLHRAWLDSSIDAVETSKNIRVKMTFYLFVLIAFSFMSATFIVFAIKREMEKPYLELLKATGRVASGDLSYRIDSIRDDEFGLISRRFDEMVGSLQKSSIDIARKLKDTELFLSIARIASSSHELKPALDLMVETIASKMDKDICGIFLYSRETKKFRLESCNKKEVPPDASLPLDSKVAARIVGTLKPFIANDASEFDDVISICKYIGSFMAVPVIRDQSCKGLLLVGDSSPDSFDEDEMNTAVIAAHTLSSAIRNMELYEETTSQLNQLGIVFELSKSLTTIFKTDELLRTISSEVAKLINTRGSAISLVENGNLKVKSSFGNVTERSDGVETPIGRGIAGWVAGEGRSMFVEDVSKMPEDIRKEAPAVTSAIVVPMRKEESVIGTLELYDKLDSNGLTIRFSIDDLKVAEGFASISAIAIDKALMREQQEKISAKVEEAKKRMDLLFESVQSGIVTLDSSYNITSANRYVERWVDRPLEEIIASNAIDVFHVKGGICPHCAAKATFEEGGVNIITQSSGLNYADLSSYPVKGQQGEVTEAVVIIQDITDRILYQEEIMGLYREVMQTKEYMESLINNSADAIVTSDMEGNVKSWNPAAEKIFGFTREETVGSFLPFIPEYLSEYERENIKKIRAGETLNLETFRKRKDGSILEASITLSPIKDVSGEIIGITGITRDITDKKRVEKELIRRNQELSRLFFISSAMRSTLELDRLLRMVLAAVTMSDGLGFNRAILFFVEEEKNILKGVMGVGPSSIDEAWQIWEKLSTEKRSLHEIMKEIDESPANVDSWLNRVSASLEIPLSEDTVMAKVVHEMKDYTVPDVKANPFADVILIQQTGTEAYAAVPLISRDKVIGALWVDNLFNKKPITEEDMKFLKGFADQVSSAIESARLFRKVSLAETELENIFRSISDMVFITDSDYTIKSINQAVAEKIGESRERIVGQKCYKVFHNMDSPWPACPHHKTLNTMKSYVEELEDPHMEGTFLTSTSPIFDESGAFLGTVHVVRDVSDIKALRERLLNAERKAALGEVAAKVAHEIRNPLVSVGGFAKRLEEKLDGNLQEYARIIFNEVNRLEQILKEILGFVRDARLSKRLVDLNDIAKGVLELLGTEVHERGNSVTTSFQEPSVMIVVDPDRVKEAVLNIIANANQATERGTITVKTYTDDGRGVIDISDTGCGIKEEELERIFDPFYTTRPSGTGLGLAIAKRIVDEHKGSIDVESDVKYGGTRFKIYLPLKEE